jgi:hypothetical protein
MVSLVIKSAATCIPAITKQQSRTANLCAATACATMQVQNVLCRAILAGHSFIGRESHRRVGVDAETLPRVGACPFSSYDSGTAGALLPQPPLLMNVTELSARQYRALRKTGIRKLLNLGVGNSAISCASTQCISTLRATIQRYSNGAYSVVTKS